METNHKPSLPVILILLLIAVSGPLGLWLLRQEETPAIEVQVLCFNIRNGHGKDGDNRWELRKDLVADVIAANKADVIGLQEVFRFQMDDLLEKMPTYDWVGVGRDGGSWGEHCPILYRSERFELIDTGTFWLSDTPDRPSTHWGNYHRRICTWAWLKDKQSGRALVVYNTHLDHRSETARRKGVRLIMETIAEQSPDVPVVFCGDFNADEDSEVIAYLKGKTSPANPIPMIDTWRVMHPNNPECGTVSRFTGSMEPMKIDSIYTTPEHEVLGAEIIRFNRDGRYPSDHYPVDARLRLK